MTSIGLVEVGGGKQDGMKESRQRMVDQELPAELPLCFIEAKAALTVSIQSMSTLFQPLLSHIYTARQTTISHITSSISFRHSHKSKRLRNPLTRAEVEVQVCRGRADLDGADIATVGSSGIAEVPNTALAISTTGDDTVSVGLELASRVGAAKGVEETLVVAGGGEGVVELGVGIAGVGGSPSFDCYAWLGASVFSCRK